MTDFLDNLCAQLTVDDVTSIMPTGLTSGAALWARLGGPEGKDSFLASLTDRPPAQTRARSGWMCGVALLIYKNKQLADKGRNHTDQMEAHLKIFMEFLNEFAQCIFQTGSRTSVDIKKTPAEPYTVNFPTVLVNQELEEWCASEWPTSDDPIALGLTTVI